MLVWEAFRPFSPPPVGCDLEWESALINIDSASWNVDLINSLFSPGEAAMIHSIPLSGMLPPDQLMWHYDAKGAFSVKSAYKVANDMRDQPSTSNQSIPAALMWNSIRKVNVPGKIKMCVWRACNILHTHSEVMSKGVEVDNTCVLCSSSSESALHVFSFCPFAYAVYLSANMNFDSQHGVLTSFCDWFSQCATSISPGQLNYFLVLLHSIWRAKNLRTLP